MKSQTRIKSEQTKEWEKEFRKIYWDQKRYFVTSKDYKELKSFISSLLLQQEKELVGEIEIIANDLVEKEYQECGGFAMKLFGLIETSLLTQIPIQSGQKE